MAESRGMLDLADPLPREYITAEPGIGGSLKQRPEDFLVDELPLYEPCGEGEHLYLGIEKSLVSHSELVGCLRRQFGVRRSDIGFAGMKDKHGITRQTISIHLAADPPNITVDHDRINVLWATRHRNKLRRGHLAGNRFSIRIRDVDALLAPRVMQQMRRLEEVGVPCYFGAQRFGYRRNNHIVGAAILREEWTAAVDELLGSRGQPFPEYQRERRELYDRGAYSEARQLWTPADRAELIAIKDLAAGRSPRDAIRGCGTTTVSFWISALQSAIFNRHLDRCIRDDTMHRLLPGDLAWKHDNGAVFAIGADELDDPEIERRFAALEISPTGPLWGASMLRAGDLVDEQEREAVTSMGLELAELLEGRLAPKGARRPLRSPIRHVEVDAGTDEHGHYIRVAFDLPRGVYATIALREIMKNEELEEGGE